LDESPASLSFTRAALQNYRGMGSMGAMIAGSATATDRPASANAEARPEGVEGRVPYRGRWAISSTSSSAASARAWDIAGRETSNAAKDREVLPRDRRQHGREPPARHHDHQGIANYMVEANQD
jgi:IMP dehydrogenase/GMP reductase